VARRRLEPPEAPEPRDHPSRDDCSPRTARTVGEATRALIECFCDEDYHHQGIELGQRTVGEDEPMTGDGGTIWTRQSVPPGVACDGDCADGLHGYPLVWVSCLSSGAVPGGRRARPRLRALRVRIRRPRDARSRQALGMSGVRGRVHHALARRGRLPC
jgi:hypothetical protein